MKKEVIFIFVAIIFLVACNKETDKNPEKYQATVKENFTDPFKQLENIQVGDYVPYQLTITDNERNDNVEYRLTPINEGHLYHQKIWVDFGLYLSNEDNTIHKEKSYISFTKKGTHNFYIRPLMPGSFKHTYEFQKFINGEAIGEPIKLSIIFNVVKITIDRTYFKIDDGDEPTDNYLSPKGIVEQKYNLKAIFINPNAPQKGEIYKGYGDFKINDKIYLKDIPEGNLEEYMFLTITQKIDNSQEFVVKYYNLKPNNN
ncbi:hypothetical protein [Capnocytophaga sputigena]|jgi:hypothetical protein|uniref:hypothetical protein n=1 Tax=Capnocytophaga sputigena TaxID=1019 RepID=UPI0028E5D976|nr:hypothetical protein [Capnocytophaga sputigena]